ncbi:MAG: nitroreductase family protein [Nitrososphaeria archaeon]
MGVFEAIVRRRSVRSYTDREIPKDVLIKLLEAARLAPSARNSQPWHFVIVTDQEKKKRIAESGRWARFISNAPAIIVGCGDREKSSKWFTVDVSIALEHIVLKATEEGLGSCWIGSFDEEVVKDVLSIPDRYSVVALISLGYPAEGLDVNIASLLHGRSRKEVEEIASLNEYGKSVL